MAEARSAAGPPGHRPGPSWRPPSPRFWADGHPRWGLGQGTDAAVASDCGSLSPVCPFGGTMQLDVRGPRFSAAVTTVVLVAIILTRSGWLALAQTVVFALGAVSPRLHPYGTVFR